MTLREFVHALNDELRANENRYSVIINHEGTTLGLGYDTVARVRTDDEQHVVQVYFHQSATVATLRHVKARLASTDISVS